MTGRYCRVYLLPLDLRGPFLVTEFLRSSRYLFSDSRSVNSYDEVWAGRAFELFRQVRFLWLIVTGFEFTNPFWSTSDFRKEPFIYFLVSEGSLLYAFWPLLFCGFWTVLNK